jgi:hypothetical protein
MREVPAAVGPKGSGQVVGGVVDALARSAIADFEI